MQFLRNADRMILFEASATIYYSLILGLLIVLVVAACCHCFNLRSHLIVQTASTKLAYAFAGAGIINLMGVVSSAMSAYIAAMAFIAATIILMSYAVFRFLVELLPSR